MSHQLTKKDKAQKSTEIDEQQNDQHEKEELLKVLQKLNMIAAPSKVKAPKEEKNHAFWSTQPVPQSKKLPKEILKEYATPKIEEITEKGEEAENHAEEILSGPIDAQKKPGDIRQEPYKIPTGFTWCELDLTDHDEATELYDLLTQNYVEDDDNMFRFDYSKEFLKWALQPPGFKKSWHVGVRNTNNNKLMAFISGIPADIKIYDEVVKMAEVNFLCIHKKLRSKRLAPVLIKEITRRINLMDIWQAIYTAGVVLPTPIAQCRYYHRSINPKKLIEVGFSRLAPRMTMARTIKYYRLLDAPVTPGFRAMESKDVADVTKLLRTYLNKFKVFPCFTEEEVSHFMLPRDGVVNCYVVENPTTHEITDVCSFYHLPSTIIGNEKYKTLNAAYSFYNVATSVPLVDLMNDCLIMARESNFDVFNCLNLMDNESFIKELKFGMGDGELQYYLYNWKCAQMLPHMVGTVLC